MKAAHERIGAAIEAIVPDMRVVTMDDAGGFAADGEAIDAAQVQPVVAWMGIDLFRSRDRRSFNRVVLASDALQWVQTAAAGLDNSVFTRLADKGVRLSNSDAQAPSIADFVVGGVLAHLQRYEHRRALQAAREWRQFQFRELGRTSWLIIGYGSIGREVAKRVRGFGAPVTGIRRRPEVDEHASRVVGMDQLFSILPEADVVVLACALNEETQNLVSGKFLNVMKAGSILVNIGRGGLVVERDLLAALQRGTPEYAVLDVFATEPLPEDSPFWDHPRVLVAAHAASFGDGMTDRGDELFLNNLRRFAAGEPLHKEVDTNELRSKQDTSLDYS